MKPISLKLLTLAIVFATAFLTPAQTTDDETTLKQIAGYRLWSRVNEQPVVVSATDPIAERYWFNCHMTQHNYARRRLALIWVDYHVSSEHGRIRFGGNHRLKRYHQDSVFGSRRRVTKAFPACSAA